MYMADNSDKNSKGNFPNLTRLIRSVQHIEGNPECFGKAGENCDRVDCFWREYCLKEK
jgi:hypothetical protein